MQKIHDAMNKPGVSAKLKEVLSKFSTFENVPRKKAKFQVCIISLISDYLFYHIFKIIELDEKQSQNKQYKSSRRTLGYPCSS